MRDLLVVAIFAVSLLYALRYPFVGLLSYFWVSFMNPHRFSWGFAYDLPLAMVAAAVTFGSVLFHSKELKFPRTREAYLFLLLWLFITITTVNAIYPEDAWIAWQRIAKIYLMTFVAMLLITTRLRLLYFMLAIIAYIGLIGVKGAIFGILSGGQYKIWGPPDSFIADNNGMGLAMVMIVPLCFILKDDFEKKWQRYALAGVGFALVASTILTYSRGALVGLAAIGFFLFLKSKNKIIVALTLVAVIGLGLSVLPSQWFDRMNTIKSHEEDDSANMRRNSWWMSFNLARSHLLGGGFECFTLEQYQLYAPNPDLGRARTAEGTFVGSTAHSIYFEVIATQGFIGFAIFMSCLISILFSLRRLNRISRYLPDAGWISTYSRALTVSIIGFMASGAFLSLAFFDLFWAIFAAAVCFKFIVLSGNWIEESEFSYPPLQKVIAHQNGESELCKT
jgi:probable O-glycosylation ligase (exosortase A-associated)